ncbi:MAG: hypothetical protein ACOCSD_06960 [Halolamina sp.]
MTPDANGVLRIETDDRDVKPITLAVEAGETIAFEWAERDDDHRLAPDGGVPMIVAEGGGARVVAGPEPTAFERWDRDREDGDRR